MAHVVKIPEIFAGAIKDIQSRVPEELREPKIGIVCGSGLSGLASKIRNPTLVPYSEIPGFGISTGMCISTTVKLEYSSAVIQQLPVTRVHLHLVGLEKAMEFQSLLCSDA
jgi:purine-nucleoside phosphorylase